MQLVLQNLVPIPLSDKVNSYNSSVWKQSLTLNKGEQIFIQAPSGTGKTTLVHILYGLRKDFEGMVHWDTNNIAGIGSEQLSKLRATYVSIVFQDMRLFPELTTWENLEVKRALTNTVKQEEVEEWLERLGIQERRDALAKTLSYGEQQRVAIIRALLQPFDWLLMDEPFSHLDRNNTRKAVQLIAEIVKLHKAGILLADLEDNDHFNYSRKILL